MVDFRNDERALSRILGLNIKVRRAELDMKQETLAAMIGTSASHLSGIESGRRNTSIGHLQRIAIALDISPSAWSPPRVRQSLE